MGTKNRIQKILAPLLIFLLVATFVAAVGKFVVQYPSGTDVFTVDESGNVNASGTIMESNVLLSETYLAIDATVGNTTAEIWGVADNGTFAYHTNIDGNISALDFASNANIDTNISTLNTLVDTNIDGNVTLLASHTNLDTNISAKDECSEITNCVPNAWDNLKNMILVSESMFIENLRNETQA